MTSAALTEQDGEYGALMALLAQIREARAEFILARHGDAPFAAGYLRVLRRHEGNVQGELSAMLDAAARDCVSRASP